MKYIEFSSYVDMYISYIESVNNIMKKRLDLIDLISSKMKKIGMN